MLSIWAGSCPHRDRSRAKDRDPVFRRHVSLSGYRSLFQSGTGLGRRVLEKLAAGNLKSLIGYDENELDDTGNIELRCWACAAGALGERKPAVVSLDPSWHHNYASLAWIGGEAEKHREAHYPSIKPELVELTSALHVLAHDDDMRAQYITDAGAFADRYKLSPDQREALIKLDLPTMVKMGAHPLVPFLASLQIQRLRPQR